MGGGHKNAYWLGGVHPVILALENPERTIIRIIATKNAGERLSTIIQRLKSRNLPAIEWMERHDIERILGAEGVHQGVAALIEPLQFEEAESLILNRMASNAQGLVVLLDQLHDPRNIGAILRSAAAFNVIAVVTTDKNSPGESAIMAKASSGALELVPYLKTVNLARFISFLKEQNFWIYGLDGEATRLINAVPPAPYRAIILGNEGQGLRHLTRKLCDDLIKIPMNTPSSGSSLLGSLNVSNAAAIAFYELCLHHSIAE